MIKRFLFLGALCGGALMTSSSVAQEGEGPRPLEGRGAAEMLKRADKDGDGKLSKEEFMQSRTQELEEAFARMDANGDGFIDEAEMEQVAERMRTAAGALGRDGAGRPGPGRLGAEGMRRPDGEGALRRPEGEPSPERNAAMMGQAFERMDADGNGQISREEFLQGMGRMREMLQRGGVGPGDAPGRGPGGPEGGFRRPPQQDGEGPRRPLVEGEGGGEKPEEGKEVKETKEENS